VDLMKIPKNEKSMVSHVFEGVKCYVTTKNTLNGKFSLYKIINDNDYEKLMTADTPLKFDEVIAKDRKGK
jgi:hypothetical protein